MSPGCRGRGKILRFERARADKAGVGSVCGSSDRRGRRLLRREQGQAMVEFAVIAPLFLMIVVGIIQFGVALNYWLDMQRIANEGARWAVVNAYPGCDRTAPLTPACPAPAGKTYVDGSAIPDMLHYQLAASRIAQGEDIKPFICFPANTGPPPVGGGAATPVVGDPVKVYMTRRFDFLPIVKFRGQAGSVLSTDLKASATMRLEQKPTRYVADGPCP